MWDRTDDSSASSYDGGRHKCHIIISDIGRFGQSERFGDDCLLRVWNLGLLLKYDAGSSGRKWDEPYQLDR